MCQYNQESTESLYPVSLLSAYIQSWKTLHFIERHFCYKDIQLKVKSLPTLYFSQTKRVKKKFLIQFFFLQLAGELYGETKDLFPPLTLIQVSWLVCMEERFVPFPAKNHNHYFQRTKSNKNNNKKVKQMFRDFQGFSSHLIFLKAKSVNC